MCKYYWRWTMEIKKKVQRKSLAVDEDTYNLLNEICGVERRTKNAELKILIEAEHDRIFARQNYRPRVNV